ncbi:YitT family protein [Agrilactobacillus yilanensis]|uniref:YitT family protein n=1 Tax=Agrilactobacillus yilanensis TaxID=2485997 RepID=A0ABW4J6M7_9LACO|nr:DUF6198 family protein [Agrilactobacillus yilanensis]
MTKEKSENMPKEKMSTRIVVWIIGMFVLALGTSFFAKSHMGVSALVSVPQSCSLISGWTLGVWVNIIYAIFVVLELFIYRKFSWQVIVQFPFTFIFGRIVDMWGIHIFGNLDPDNIWLKIIILVLALFCTAAGVTMMVHANIIVNPPDGILMALTTVIPRDYGTLKYWGDALMVVIAVIIGLVTGNLGKLIGPSIGWGTIIAVFTIGNMVKFFNKVIVSKVSPVKN